MISGGISRLLRLRLGCRYRVLSGLLNHDTQILLNNNSVWKGQKNVMCNISNMPQVSLSAKLISEKDSSKDEINCAELDRTKTLNEIKTNLKELGSLVENEIKSATAAYRDEDIEEEETSSINVKVSNSSNTVEVFGTPDPLQAISSIPCPGCGAKLHCKDPGIPGYIPSQIFLSKQQSNLKNQQCQRCQILITKKVALDLTVSVDKYGPITREIRRHSALIVLLVDMTDPSNSFHSTFKDLLSLKRPMYVIGNKVDLLPKDSQGYLKRLKESLVSISHEHGFNTSSNVVYFDLISAKTGFGMEKLISKMLKFWKLKGNVFIIGCTNSGKSTLYNSLLASDFCRSSATEILSRATTSTWPGTTLNLLKFPIINPKPTKLLEREQRLKRDGGGDMEKVLLKSIKNRDRPDLHSPLTTTFLSPTQMALSQQHTNAIVPSYSYEATNDAGDPLLSHTGMKGASDYLSLKVMPYDDSSFKFWCFDTPGLVNQEQVINLLSAEELSLTIVTRKQLQPRIILLRPLQTVFVSALGRIDYLEGNDNLHLSVYSSHQLPIHTMPTTQADDFYKLHFGSPTLGIPIVTPNDPRNLPALEGREMMVVGRGIKEGAADVVLSSIGWVSVSARQNLNITLKAYTPQTKGLSLRQPPLIRNPYNNMGHRIQGTNRYMYKKVELGTDDQ